MRPAANAGTQRMVELGLIFLAGSFPTAARFDVSLRVPFAQLPGRGDESCPSGSPRDPRYLHGHDQPTA